MRTNAEVIADALFDHGTRHTFGLMGDGNMHLIGTMAARGIEIVEVRHESNAVAMAEGYAMSSGRTGVATVTHGPGLTHIATSLVVAARNRSPIVILAGETPSDYTGAQQFDQQAFVAACEAEYRLVGPDDDAGRIVAMALRDAMERSGPVVVAIPSDLLQLQPGRGEGTRRKVEVALATTADSEAAAAGLFEALASAARPVILAGRGVIESGTSDLIVRLAEQFGAALATTLPAKGLFDGSTLDLGIAGGLSAPEAERVFAAADLVIGVGTTIGSSTSRGGRLFPHAQVYRLDMRAGDRARRSDAHLVLGEARHVLTQLVDQAVATGERREPWFMPLSPWPGNWAEELVSYSPDLPPGTVDPRRAVIDLDAVLPDDALIVIANGHSSGFASALLRGGRPRTTLLAQGFGAIGQGLTTALGVAVGAPDRQVVVFEGDAGFMMHAQELDTVARSGARLTVVVFNDEALGTEYHRLVVDDGSSQLAMVPACGIAELAHAAGAHSTRVTSGGGVVPAVNDALSARFGVVEIMTARTVESRHLRWRRMPAPEPLARPEFATGG
nr:thiamine pyrophosphate-binding protein [Microbacterium bovistercoris]